MPVSYKDEIAAYAPRDAQEAASQHAIRWCIDRFGDALLTRANPIAHITSSGFIMNHALDKALMIHHNIRATWAWTGGHADGDADLLHVAIKEAMEETGAKSIVPLQPRIASLDVLPVYPHQKNGQAISAHLHLSVAYILLCDETDALRVKPDENTGVRWFPIADICAPQFSDKDVALYGKLIRWAQANR